MAHLYEGNRNFNHMMNKREIERKITSENFLQNTFIISIPHETACKINFHPDEDVLMAKPVIKMPKFSDGQSPFYSFPPGSFRFHSATSSRYTENTNKANAFWGTRKNVLLSERENF